VRFKDQDGNLGEPKEGLLVEGWCLLGRNLLVGKHMTEGTFVSNLVSLVKPKEKILSEIKSYRLILFWG